MENHAIQFESKKNYTPIVVVVFIQIALLALLAWAFNDKFNWVDLLFPLVSLFFMLFDYWNIHYRIEHGVLYIRSGWQKVSFPVKEIRKIRKVKTWLSAPATSNHRLELTYKKYNHTWISPKDIDGFIAAVKVENPEVEISL